MSGRASKTGGISVRPKPFELVVKGWQDFTVKAYEPFPAAPFVAHRSNDDGQWLVTHRNSTMIAAPADTLKAALVQAKTLSEQCPSAPKVKLKLGPDGCGLFGKLTGPHRRFRDELAAALGIQL